MAAPNLWGKLRPEGECWTFGGRLDRDGYGRIDVKVDGKWVAKGAHRVSYEEMVGPIPADLTLDHTCQNRACCNPEHLDPCPQKENYRRAVRRMTKEAP